MPAKKNKSLINLLTTIPVVLIIISAFVLCGMAVVENLRFIQSTDQIISLVDNIHTVASLQNTFGMTPNEDLWNALATAGRPMSNHVNPWMGSVRARTVANSIMRVESDLPTHNCRRTALYFIEHNPQAVGIIGIEAKDVDQPNWSPIYTPPAQPALHAVEMACGHGPYASLAIIIRIRRE